MHACKHSCSKAKQACVAFATRCQSVRLVGQVGLPATDLCAAGELCPLRGAGAACAALADQASQLLLQLPGPRRCNLPTLGPAAAGVSSGGHRDSALAAAPAVARRPQAAAGQPLQPDGQPTAPPMLAAALVSVGRLPAPAATNSPGKRRRALAAAAGIAGCSPGSRRTLRDGARSCSSPCTSLRAKTGTSGTAKHPPRL